MIYASIEELLNRILELEKENRELITEIGETEKKLFSVTAKLINLQHANTFRKLAESDTEE